MTQAALVLVVLVFPVILLAGIVIAFVAYARTRRLERDLGYLRDELQRLRGSTQGAAAKSSTPASAPVAPAAGGRAEVATAPPPATVEPRSAVPAPAAPFAVAPSSVAPRAPALESSAASSASAAPSSAPIQPAPLAPPAPGERASHSATPSSNVAAAAPPSPARSPVSTRPDAAPTAAPRPRVPIERIIGVTGAAVVGGILLAIAGLVFYRYSVQHNWITPTVRVWMGAFVGIACLVGSSPLRRRGYAITADAIAGAGAVVLYADFWSAHALFQLWPMGLSFVAMAAVTCVCCALAWRHSSQLIAGLGLMGGFATPLVLASGQDRPIGLFGYTLLVNLGFLSVAHRRRWPWVALLALGGTFAIEGLWIFARLDGDELVIGLCVLAVFAALFVVLVALQPDGERRRWMASAAAAIVAPFGFALYFVGTPDLAISAHLYPTTLLAVLLSLAAGWLARRQGAPLIPLGTAAGSVVIPLVWVLTKPIDAARTWELVACALGLALVQLVHIELVARSSRIASEGEDVVSRATFALASGVIATLGLLGTLMLACAKCDCASIWPWAVGGVALALIAARMAARSGQEWLVSVAALPCGLLLSLACADLERRADLSTTFVHVLAAAVFGVIALLRGGGAGRRASAHAVAILCLCGFAGADFLGTPASSAWGSFAPERWTLLGLAIVCAGHAARTTSWLAIGVLATVARHTILMWGANASPFLKLVEPQGYGWLVPHVLLAVVLLAIPWTSLVPFGGAWARVRAASMLAWWFPLAIACKEWLKDDWRGVPLALLAVPAIAYGWLERARRRASGDETRSAVLDVSRRWFAAVALALVVASVPFQLDRQEWLVAGTLVGAALTWLALREQRATLAVAASVLLGASAACSILIRVGAEWPLDGERAGLGWWLAWMYLVPAIAALLASVWVRRSSSEARAQTWLAPCASGCAITATVLVFAWLHLTLLNAFGSSATFRWPSDRMPARDLTISLAWASYALALLVLGVNRNASGPRWASLVLLLVTLAKVFLFDLGNLSGLYLVGSLAGLALSLFAVSLLYQRFVFRRVPASAPATGGPAASESNAPTGG